MTLPWALPSMRMPSPPLGTAICPLVSMPIRFRDPHAAGVARNVEAIAAVAGNHGGPKDGVAAGRGDQEPIQSIANDRVHNAGKPVKVLKTTVPLAVPAISRPFLPLPALMFPSGITPPN